jgi:hypothetical protein
VGQHPQSPEQTSEQQPQSLAQVAGFSAHVVPASATTAKAAAASIKNRLAIANNS